MRRISSTASTRTPTTETNQHRHHPGFALHRVAVTPPEGVAPAAGVFSNSQGGVKSPRRFHRRPRRILHARRLPCTMEKLPAPGLLLRAAVQCGRRAAQPLIAVAQPGRRLRRPAGPFPKKPSRAFSVRLYSTRKAHRRRAGRCRLQRARAARLSTAPAQPVDWAAHHLQSSCPARAAGSAFFGKTAAQGC